MGVKKLIRILSILMIALNAVCISGSIYIIVQYYGKVYQMPQTFFLLTSFIIAAACLFLTFTKEYHKKLIPIGIAASFIITIIGCILFFIFLPKYSVKEAYAVIKEDPEYMSAEVGYIEYISFGYRNKNPYIVAYYEFDVKNNDNSTEHIYFAPDTGEYGTSP